MAPTPGWQGRFPQNDIISLLDVNRTYNLAESTSRNLTLGELADMVGGFEALRDIELGYGSSAGLRELRERVAADCGVSADAVITTQGTALGLFMLAFELCRPADRVVLATPCFPPSRDTLRACAVAIDELNLSFDTGYKLDPERLSRLLTEETRLVSLASPQNPNGVRISLEALREVLKLMSARAPRARLFVDETYRAAAYGNEPVAASAASLDARVIVGASISKAHGAPGLRCGWLVTQDAELRERLVVAKLNLTISGSVLDEALGARLLALGGGALKQRNQQLARSLAVLAHWCEQERAHVDWVRPDAGALCCLRLRRDVFDDAAVERFWAALPAQELQLGSGEWFGDAEGRRVFRLGFGFLPESALEPALSKLSHVLRSSR